MSSPPLISHSWTCATWPSFSVRVHPMRPLPVAARIADEDVRHAPPPPARACRIILSGNSRRKRLVHDFRAGPRDGLAMLVNHGSLSEKLSVAISLQKSLTTVIMTHRWMKGAQDAPDGKRPHPPRMGETEGISIKGRGCEILAGMKGWRPSACPLGSKPVRARFKRTNSCRTSDRSACLFRGSPGFWLRGRAGSLFRAHRGSAAARVGRKRRPSVRDHENGASPSPRSKRPEELEMKTKETTHEPGRTGSADAARGLL